jgi:lactoylglutathione lyase
MKFTIAHNNYNVFDMEKSLAFYQRRSVCMKTPHRAEDGSFLIIYWATSRHLILWS